MYIYACWFFIYFIFNNNNNLFLAVSTDRQSQLQYFSVFLSHWVMNEQRAYVTVKHVTGSPLSPSDITPGDFESSRSLIYQSIFYALYSQNGIENHGISISWYLMLTENQIWVISQHYFFFTFENLSLCRINYKTGHIIDVALVWSFIIWFDAVLVLESQYNDTW